MSQEIVPTEINVPELRRPQEIVQEARERANVLMDIVKEQRLAVRLGNKEHIQVEAWQTVGRFFNCSAGADEAEAVEIEGVKGARAHAVVRDERTGHIVSESIAYCMRDEPNWQGKPWFQIASMAQTRAMSKALANKFRWVAVLAGYSGTPAEEMTGEDKAKPATTTDTELTWPWGANKGRPISQLDEKSLHWGVDKLQQDLGDPKKKQYAAQNRNLLDALLDEIKAREEVKEQAGLSLT